MKSAKSVVKWSAVIVVTVALHCVVFALSFQGQGSQMQEADIGVVEIDLGMFEDQLEEETTPEAETVDNQLEEPVEELAETGPAPEEIAAEQQRQEQERQEELQRQLEIEQQRLAELERQKEVERQKKLEEQRKIEEEKRRQEEIALQQKIEEERKKREAELARRKKEEARKAKEIAVKQERDRKAAEAAKQRLAKKRAAEAAAAKKRAQAKKKAKNAYATRRSKPSYPSSLRRRKIEGTVKIKVSVSATGKVTNASIYASSGQSSFDKNAVSAVKRWRYAPAYNGLGQAIADTKIETIIFKMAK